MQRCVMVKDNALNDVLTLFLYEGEVNDLPSYSVFTLSKCCAFVKRGATAQGNGRRSNGKATLYVFDGKTEVQNAEGNVVSYVPEAEWKKLTKEEKKKHWSISDKGNDYFTIPATDALVPPTSGDTFRVVSFKKYTKGTSKMWHLEVDGA